MYDVCRRGTAGYTEVNERSVTAYQLAPDAVSCLERAEIQEVVIAPVLSLSILLECMVDIEQGQVVPCNSKNTMH